LIYNINSIKMGTHLQSEMRTACSVCTTAAELSPEATSTGFDLCGGEHALEEEGGKGKNKPISKSSSLVF
jgi:hypothetical protein